ncbi:hypothetical protein GCM10027062_24970 [Nocardioides hungaricus]
MQRPSLAAVRPDLAGQWHPTRNAPLTPADVRPGSGKRVWWLDELGHEWESTINNRKNGTGCPFCAGNRVLTGFNDLATKAPHIAAEWHPTRNGDLTPGLVATSGGRKYWWQCKDGHEWQMTVGNRTFGDQGCPVCAGQRVLPGVNDMATTAPGLAAEWHPSRNAPLTPTHVFRSTARKFWWQCSLGHEWEASANSRSNGSNCPFCSGHRILISFNDLASVRPEIAAEWHPTRNERTPQMVTAMNGTKVWWRCDRDGHEWQTTVASRSRGNGCPACAGQTVRPGVNDLASRAPAIAAEWHPTRNEGLWPAAIAVYSNRKAWWRCSAGHEWESTVNNRTHGQGCPECAERGGFNPGRPGYVYLLEHSALGALKIGVTNEGTTRLAMFQARAWQVLNLEYFSIGADAAAVERAIKAWWRRDLGLPAWLGPAEMSATGGWTETIASAELAAADCIERVRDEGAAAKARSCSAAASDGIASLA